MDFLVDGAHLPLEPLFLGFWMLGHQLLKNLVEGFLLGPGFPGVELEGRLKDARVVESGDFDARFVLGDAASHEFYYHANTGF